MAKLKFVKLIRVGLFLLSLFTIHYLLFTRVANAVCPVCTVAVGAGLGISRALGVDDTVTSVWIGGLVLSMSFWLIDYLARKYPKIRFRGYKLLIIIAMYILVIVPLILSKIVGLSHNKIFGIDKIIFGAFIGSLVFLLAKWGDQKVRESKGRQLFNYQRVVFPVTSLTIASIVMYFVSRII